ncbi:Small G protein signaling modulator 2 [Hypsibius exemplaris]|uniref:Small G protein signaling modulator 2 n=1 Tax=Hypsibius exemplaris TaxID=2072580 RepID=A0A1W0WDX1_HYPEX|nr:Small G protein signaling modulator 2 [Hypsibius exemplaris]
MTDSDGLDANTENGRIKERLMKLIKKDVKQIMEESVTRKYISEDSSSITALSASVEACLSYGLKRRTLGLFKTASNTAALLQKISKYCEEAEMVKRIVCDFEPVVTMTSFGSKKGIFETKKGSKSVPVPKKIPGPVMTHKFLWIRIALTERVLDKIVDYLVRTADKYYSQDSLIADPVDGPVLASLLVGPSALDFSKMKTPDHLWTDPPADELVLRHRIHGSAVQYQLSSGSLNSPKHLGLKIKRGQSHSTSSCEEAPRGAAKNYVESLHQNNKSTLLYGKNNVYMRPRDHSAAMPGYLSLHQGPDGILAVKWTPNQLMNIPAEESFDTVVERSQYWDYAICIFVPSIVYLHCHHQHDNNGSVVLVSQDGIQHPPFDFPPGGHLLAFLSCLETGLLPTGKLDPPLWYEPGVGKVFPHLKRKTVQTADLQSMSYDYVFRVICDLPNLSQSKFNLLMQPESAVLQHPLRQTSSGAQSMQSQTDHHSSSNSNSGTNSHTADMPNVFDFEPLELGYETGDSRSTMQRACDTMKRQIQTRAFYGWLAHCRHLRTVRHHLSGLIVEFPQAADSPTDASKGLTKDIWQAHQSGATVLSDVELCRLIYYGGLDSSLRKDIWPCLLHHYSWTSTKEQREIADTVVRIAYEDSISEWMAVEAIIRQKDKEAIAASIAKVTTQQSGDIPLVGKDSSLSNDVFEDDLMSTDGSVETPSEWTLSASGGLDRKFSQHSCPGNDGPNCEDGEILILTKSASYVVEGLPPHSDDFWQQQSPPANVMVTQATVDFANHVDPTASTAASDDLQRVPSTGMLGEEMKDPDCPSPASSVGGIYTEALIDEFSLNLHRIDKDVARCDRTHWYFTQTKNLEKLRNLMNTYVWLNLKEGYVQGMCDLAAPLLVIFDDEVMAYTCFTELMKRMIKNFPSGGGMDRNFANMRSLIQVLDPELFDLMKTNGDYTHFYFCYRWFLLDFKRELVYDDVYAVWETIWAAGVVASADFVLFLALAMLECYRDIILDNVMDFTDTIKFFNEMAERHDGKTVLKISRDLVQRIQDLIANQ